jgi:hypothetical protein
MRAFFVHKYLTMANLGGKEIYKRPGRVETFLTKLKSNSPFELETGGAVVLVNDPEIEKSLLAGKEPRTIPLKTTDEKIISFTQLKKTKEFGGGSGSGAGSENTGVNESAQAVYCAAKWDKVKSYTLDNLQQAYSKVEVTASFDAIMGLPEKWIDSSVLIADALYAKYGNKPYKFHRQSSWVKSLEGHFEVLNKTQGKPFSDINKWSPADIYMTTKEGMAVPFLNARNLAELNRILLKSFNSKDIIGISLKAISRHPNLKAYNVGEPRKEIKYSDYTTGKISFFNSKDVFIFFSINGSIQFRTFPAFQGEIKGVEASQGKIGFGNIALILRQILGSPISDISTTKGNIARKDPKLYNKFYNMYLQLDKKDTKKKTYEEFIAEVSKKDAEWQLSKFMGCDIVSTILNNGIQNQFINDVVSYASSTSKLSGPYLKTE